MTKIGPKGNRASSPASEELTRQTFLRLAGMGVGAGSLAGVLTSCSGFIGGDNAGSSGGGPLEIFATTEEKKPLGAMVDSYRSQHDDLRFDVTYAETTRLNSRLRTQLTSGAAADMFRVAPGGGSPTAVKRIAPKDYLVDLSSEPWTSRMGQNMTNLCSANGKVYGFPATLTVMPTFYNKDVFRKVGVEPPTTWDELLATCEKIKKAGIKPMALGLADPALIQMIPYALVASTVYSENPNFAADLAAGKSSFVDSEGWHEALEKFLSLKQRDYFNRNPLGTSFDQAMRLVASGDAAMITFVSSAFSQMASYASPSKFGAFATPGLNEPQKVRLPASPIDVFGVNAEGSGIEEAKKFIRFMAQPGNIAEFAQLSASLPGIDTKKKKVPPVLEQVMKYVEQERTVHYMNHLWPNAEVQQALFVAGQRMFSGEITVKDALKKMDQARG